MKKIIVALSALLLFGCDSKKTEEKEALPQVKVAPVKVEKVSYYIDSVGNAEAFQSVDVIPQVGGEVIGYYFKDGNDVSKGDLLYLIDPTPYIANLEESVGQLDQAKASYEYQLQKVDRYQGLRPDDYVSELDYQQYVSQLNVAKGQVEQFEGAVRKAKVELDYATISAPFDGRCGMHAYDPGSVVRANQEKPLLTLNQISPIYLMFTVPEKYLNLIRKYQDQSEKGLKIVIIPLDGKRSNEEAYLDFIDNTVDQNSGTVKLRGLSPNEGKSLWPGQYLSYKLEVYDLGESVLVPEGAVNRDTKGAFVLLATKENTAEIKRVELGQQQGTYFVATKGLSKGDLVIVEGQSSLKPGAKFEVKP